MRRIFTILTTAYVAGCGSTDIPAPVQPIKSGTKISALQSVPVLVSSSADKNLVIKDRESCIDLINFLNRVKPEWKIDNPFKRIQEGQSSWHVSSTEADNFFSVYPNEMESLTVTIDYRSNVQTITCLLPKKWKAVFHRDAVVSSSAALKDYNLENDLSTPKMKIGAKGGVAFIHGVEAGFHSRLAWALEPVLITNQDIISKIVKEAPFVAPANLELEVLDLINRKVPAPVEIFSFSHGVTISFPTFFVKPKIAPDLPFEKQLLLPYHDPRYFDLSIEDPVESINRNAKGSFENMVLIDAKTLKPVECLKNAPVTEAKGCQRVAKDEMFRHFAPLFESETTDDERTCILSYFKLAEPLTLGGLVKVICIDKRGNLNLRYNKITKFATDAMADLKDRSSRGDKPEL